MPPKKDQAPIYIDGPKMDWSMDDGLYSCFQDWKLECKLILCGELAEITEPGKSHSFNGLDHSVYKTSRCGRRIKPTSPLLSSGKSLRPTASCTQMSCELGTNCSNSLAKVQLLVMIGTQQYKIN